MRNFILFFFFLYSFSLFSQQFEADIEIVYFNSSASYAKGSGVSIHINPKGVYKLSDINLDGEISEAEINNVLNNSFILQLTDSQGNYIQDLSQVNDFYTPLINGDLPNNLSPGDYRLRVKATHAKIYNDNGTSVIDTGATEEVFVSSEIFTVIEGDIENDISFYSQLTEEINASSFECTNENINRVNPQFGALSVQQNSGTSAFMYNNGGPDGFDLLNFGIVNSESSKTYNVNLINISDGSIVSLNEISDFLYQIPAFDNDDNDQNGSEIDLDVGTYIVEIEEISDNISNFSRVYFYGIVMRPY